MKKTFVIISVSDRIKELNNLVRSIRIDKRFDDYDLNLYFQDPKKVINTLLHREFYDEVFVVPELKGCHGARVELLRLLDGKGYTNYVNLDDDMELGTFTDYDPGVEFSNGAGVGFVMTNWARTTHLLQKKLLGMFAARNSSRFTKQIMLYNGGGMIYSEKIAALMRGLEPVKTAFDCAWPITAYVNGYSNYRDQGSLAVHQICGVGGMSFFMKYTPLHTMCGEWLTFEPTRKQDGTCKSVKIPLDVNVREVAHEQHRLNKKG